MAVPITPSTPPSPTCGHYFPSTGGRIAVTSLDGERICSLTVDGAIRTGYRTLGGRLEIATICWSCRWAQMQSRGPV